MNPTPPRMLPEVRYHPSILMPGPAAEASRERQAVPAQHRPRRSSDPVRSEVGTTCSSSLGCASDSGDLDGLNTWPSSSPDPGLAPLLLGPKMDRREAERVELLTRGQRSNPAWFSWRRNRITASVAHSIAHCGFVKGSREAPPASYLAAVTGEGQSRVTRALMWGMEREGEAIRSYQESRPAVSVQACGLFVDWRRPWLAASPDGIVTDRQTGVRLRCLEVKCPFKHRHRRLEDACRDPGFCLEPTSDLSFRLKRSHGYFTQVQCQMAVTGLLSADFVVYTMQELAVVPVTFDPDFWAKTLPLLEKFYRQAVVPHLRRGALQRAREVT
ncbi:uncharacterized protein LOC128768020 isoform X2 [Synchiropus splendidus]|nr:uncharacterized protein LOC128768020 isoform X2 [Synchiropus splendidus]XP_053736526.1 uncharacterized protein LOC128768020 isoform X2 [Synchiropus splendidus]